jgi:glycosyltransferase involved in cell wall biosynthesis
MVEPEIHQKWIDPEGRSGLVSVVTPALNRARLIGETLGSALAQTYDSVEVLVVDDGSDDGTAGVAGAWEERFRTERGWSMRVLSNPGRGPSAARNAGTRASQGEFLCYLDSDDLLLPDKMRLQVEHLRAHPLHDAVYNFTVTFHHERPGSARQRVAWVPPDPASSVLRGWGLLWASPELLLWRRATIASLGPWDEELTYPEDWEYLARFLVLGGRLGCVPRVLSRTRQHGASLTSASAAAARHQNVASALWKVHDLLIRRSESARLRDLSVLAWRQACQALRDDAPEASRTIGALLSRMRQEGALAPVVRLAVLADGTVRPLTRRLAKQIIHVQHRLLRRRFAVAEPEGETGSGGAGRFPVA